MPLNFIVPKDLKFLVGGVDFTYQLGSLTFGFPRFEPTTPLIITGSARLYDTINPRPPEELDHRLNPYRWAPGSHPVRVEFAGQYFTLRIKETKYNEEEQDGAIVKVLDLTLTDLLGMVEGYQPPSDLKGIEVGRDTPVAQAVYLMFQFAGLIRGVQYLPKIDTPPISGIVKSPITVREGGVKTGTTWAGERGALPYCDRDEHIRWVRYPVNGGDPIYRKSRQEVEHYREEGGLEQLAYHYVVTGSYEDVIPCPSGDRKCWEERGTLGVGLEQVIKRTCVTKNPASVPFDPGPTVAGYRNVHYILTEEWMVLGALMPDLYPDNYSWVPSGQTVEKWVYDSVEGKAVYHGIEERRPIGTYWQAHPERFTMAFAKNTQQQWSYRQNKQVKRLVTTTKEATAAVFKDAEIFPAAPIVSEITDETWSAVEGENPGYLGTIGIPPCGGYIYRKIIKKPAGTLNPNPETYDIYTSNGGVDDRAKRLGFDWKNGTEERGSTPPSPPVMEPPFPLEQKTYKGEAWFQWGSLSPFAPRTKEYQAQTLNNQGEAQSLAFLLGTLDHQRYFSRLINHPVAPLLSLILPLSIVDVHDGRWVCDALTYVLSEDGEMEENFTGNWLGSIPVIPPPPEPPVWVPPLPADGLGEVRLLPLPPLYAEVGRAIAPIVLQAVGGSGSYVFEVSGLPPGLSVVDNAIVGVPSATLSGDVVVVVRDLG